jgi:carboxyl-terminal processing protease
MVLDLRGNGGGYLNAAYELADQFLDGQKMIVYTEGTKSPRKEYRSSEKGELEEGKLVVLIDESSASASEILSGAIQDWDRGLIIGRRSYGKGLVQQQYYLTDGSMVRLTTAHYYTPSGRCIQRSYEDGVDEYRKDPIRRFENGELFIEDSIHLDQEQSYKTKMNARTVYGGGGIMPDIFVPMDTSKYYQYYNELLRKNLIYDKVLSTMDKSRDQFKKKYPTFEKYNAGFEVDDEVIDDIVAKGEKEGIEKDEESLQFIRSQMKLQIKALFARDLFSVSYYYQIINTDDKTIGKALEVIHNSGVYNKLLAESK